MKKYKATGCARFFLVMLILAPLAYIGASYYNGQDPIENIKGLFGSSGEEANDGVYTTPPAESDPSPDETAGRNNDDASEIEQLVKANKDLAEENKSLKIQIEALKKEIEMLKNPPSGNE